MLFETIIDNRMIKEMIRIKILTTIFVICCFTPILASDKKKSQSAKTNLNGSTDKGIFSGAKATNLIPNPGFENKTSNWILGKYNGGAGLFCTDTASSFSGNRYAIINSKNTNKDFQDLQLFTSLPIAHQTKYTISFEAMVKTTCLISISLSNGFETHFEEKLLLRPGQEWYGPFVFNSNIEDPFTYFAFNLGKSNTTIHIDQVEIVADQTEKEFNNIISKSGININQKKLASEQSLYISSPTIAKSEIPILIYDEDNNVIIANKINKGEYEAMVTLDKSIKKGKYCLKIFTPEKLLTHNFLVY